MSKLRDRTTTKPQMDKGGSEFHCQLHGIDIDIDIDSRGDGCTLLSWAEEPQGVRR